MRKNIFIAILLGLSFLIIQTDVANAALSLRRSETKPAPSQVVEETPLTKETFANYIDIDGKAGAVLSYNLPEAVFSGVFRQGADDLCVFNSAGNPVPFLVRRTGSATDVVSVEQSLPFFFWQKNNADSSINEQSLTISNLGVNIEVDINGNIVGVRGSVNDQARIKDAPSYYVIDMQSYLAALTSTNTSDSSSKFLAQDARSKHLTVEFVEDTDFMCNVTMQTSSDLSSWASVGSQQALAHMKQADFVLERNTLTLPNSIGRYLLLTFSKGAPVVKAFNSGITFDKTQMVFQETMVEGQLSTDKMSINYTLPGYFPLGEIGFELPQIDMMPVVLASSNELNGRYYAKSRGVIYKLEQDGVTIQSIPFDVNGNSSKYWKISAIGDIPFDVAPKMQVYWQPVELVFLARGEGPWTLAFGRSDSVNVERMPLLDHSQTIDVTSASALYVNKNLNVSVVDKAQKDEALSPDSSRQALLWGVLILAVVILGGITFWLIRSMRK